MVLFSVSLSLQPSSNYPTCLLSLFIDILTSFGLFVVSVACLMGSLLELLLLLASSLVIILTSSMSIVQIINSMVGL